MAYIITQLTMLMISSTVYNQPTNHAGTTDERMISG